LAFSDWCMRNTFFVSLLAFTLLLTGCESPRSARLREGLERDLAEVLRRQGVAPAEVKCGLVIEPEEGTTCHFHASAEEVARIARGLRPRAVAGDDTPEEGAGRGVCSTASDLYRLKLLQVYELPGGEVTLVGGRSFGRLIVCHRRQEGEGQAVVAYKRGAS
jgi:hypothetical protein